MKIKPTIGIVVLYLLLFTISGDSVVQRSYSLLYPETFLKLDTFFDRVVSILALKRNHIVTGIFIKSDLVLTSFNALRTQSYNNNTLHKIKIQTVYGRCTYNGVVNFVLVDIVHDIVCGRQVIPSDPIRRPIDMQHGQHSPLHDLMVLRLKYPVKFINPVPPAREDFSDFESWPKWYIAGNRYCRSSNYFGPIRSILAKPGDSMHRDEMKFASAGHLSDEHIKKFNRHFGFLDKGEFGDIADCEEWLPREWGHFICLENSKNYPGLAAGAVLYSGEKLFGIGAFMLEKRKRSILVFTDVRPYWHLLHRTCTKEEQSRINL